MAKAKNPPAKKAAAKDQAAAQVASSTAPSSAVAASPTEQGGLTWMQKFELMNEPVELDDRPQPKYIQEGPISEAQKKRNSKLLEDAKSSEVVQLLLKSEDIARKEHMEALRRNAKPFRKEDEKLWKKTPLIPGPNGLPMVRKSVSKDNAFFTFIDFVKQFQLGIWGFQQKPYPPQKPFDPQQVLGSKFLENRYFDFAMRGGNFYYKDRMGRTRGPCEVVNLKTAWAAGIIDKNTFVWGDDMDEFAPIGMVYGLEQAIATPDIRFAAAGTALFYRLGFGRNPLAPLRGHERKSPKRLQKEALEKRERENNILRNAGGAWPGFKSPGHSLFFWAGGGETSALLDKDELAYSGKYITYEARKKLAEVIPGLRPWMVNEVEQVYDFITFQDNFYREQLGQFTAQLGFQKREVSRLAQELPELFAQVKDEFPEEMRALEDSGRR